MALPSGDTPQSSITQPRRIVNSLFCRTTSQAIPPNLPDARDRTPERCSTPSSSRCAPAASGTGCRATSETIARSIVPSKGGRPLVSSPASGPPSSVAVKSWAVWTGNGSLPTPRWARPVWGGCNRSQSDRPGQTGNQAQSCRGGQGGVPWALWWRAPTSTIPSCWRRPWMLWWWNVRVQPSRVLSICVWIRPMTTPLEPKRSPDTTMCRISGGLARRSLMPGVIARFVSRITLDP